MIKVENPYLVSLIDSFKFDICEQGEKDVYKITFDDGSFAECGLEHLWKCQTSYSRGHKNGKWELKSLKEMVPIA